MSGILHGSTATTARTVTAESFPGVSALLRMNGANNSTTITDATGRTTWAVANSAKLSTAVFKFGTASAYCGPVFGDNTIKSTSSLYAFGTGPFTIEMWARRETTAAAGSSRGVFQLAPTFPQAGNTNSLGLALLNTGECQIYANNTSTNGGTWAAQTWYHFALVRNDTTTVLYQDGTAIITVTGDATDYTGQAFGLGSIFNVSSLVLDGYIDDVRVSRFARYTDNFTPPGAL